MLTILHVLAICPRFLSAYQLRIAYLCGVSVIKKVVNVSVLALKFLPFSTFQPFEDGLIK